MQGHGKASLLRLRYSSWIFTGVVWEWMSVSVPFPYDGRIRSRDEKTAILTRLLASMRTQNKNEELASTMITVGFAFD